MAVVISLTDSEKHDLILLLTDAVKAGSGEETTWSKLLVKLNKQKQVKIEDTNL